MLPHHQDNASDIIGPLFLRQRALMSTPRNPGHDAERVDNVRRSTYDFDFDVMRALVVCSFAPSFFRPGMGNALEVGGFKGDYTTWLTEHFTDLSCVGQEARFHMRRPQGPPRGHILQDPGRPPAEPSAEDRHRHAGLLRGCFEFGRHHADLCSSTHSVFEAD